MHSTKDLFNYMFEMKSSFNDIQKRVLELESFKSKIMTKKDIQRLPDVDYDLDPKVLSSHFSKSYENFRQLKKKFVASKDYNSMWAVYCKAYYTDNILK